MQIENWRDLMRIIGQTHLANELGVRKETVNRWINKFYNIPPKHFKKIELTLIDCGYPNITPETLKKFNILLDQEFKKKRIV